MGAWIWFLQDGHGPTTPAKLAGTVNLIEQAGQKNEMVASDIPEQGS
jgi:hypothetical protein